MKKNKDRNGEKKIYDDLLSGLTGSELNLRSETHFTLQERFISIIYVKVSTNTITINCKIYNTIVIYEAIRSIQVNRNRDETISKRGR